MLKVLYQKLRLKCKGSLNHNNYSNLSKLQLKEARKLDKVGRVIVQGIPVLSIFALVGIVICSFVYVDKLTNSSSIADLANFILSSESNKAYAEEGITPLADTSASLTVDDGKIKDTIFATNGEFAYASHKITLEANNIKSYSLTLTRNIDLTGPTGGEGNSGVVGAAGKTPDQMDNAWGYAFINDGADPTSATYQTLASSNTLSGPAIDNNHNLSGSKQLVFGAKFGNTAASGTYHAEATLSLVATPRVVTNYIVNVNCNSGTNCTSTLNTTSDEESYNYTISSTTPTRSGYKFLGYNTSNTTTANANYAPGKTITLTAASPTLNLYAIWQEDAKGIKSITKMQEMTPQLCKVSEIGDTNTLTDTRDNSTYTVKKLNNEQCWMTQNLRIVNKTITSADSNVTANFTIPASSTSGFSNVTKANVYYGNNTAYGAYYSWCAATADTCGSATSAGVNATASICPKGWYLPVGGTGTSGTNTGASSDAKNDFMTMAGKTNTNEFTNVALVSNASINLGTTIWPFAGQYTTNSLNNSNTHGFFWSRTADSSTRAFDLYANNDGRAVLADNDFKNYGFSVRCVAYSS